MLFRPDGGMVDLPADRRKAGTKDLKSFGLTAVRACLPTAGRQVQVPVGYKNYFIKKHIDIFARMVEW